MTILPTIAPWFGMDWRRIIYVIAIPVALIAAVMAFHAYVNAKVDAAVDRARADWIDDQRAAEVKANAAANESFAKSTTGNRAKQKDLNNAAQKGDDSSVGIGTNAVLEGLSAKPARSR